MYYESFYSRFPAVAAEETRVMHVYEGASVPLPPDEYGMVESYCATPGCDCRRVFLNVISKQTGETQAVISYGWESRGFYVKWFGSDDPEIIANLKGPTLASGQSQSSLAPQLLEMVTQIVLTDPAYIERLQRHYQMFKATLVRSKSSLKLRRTSRKKAKG